MSDFENPYQSPETPIIPVKMPSAGTGISGTALRYLKEASPWLRFVGIIGLIGSGLTVIGGIIAVFFTLAVTASDFSEDFPVWLSLIYLPAGVLLFFPAFFTYNFGAKIRNYLFSNLEEDLELALKNNKSLWKFNGILSIIYLSAIPVGFIILIVVGIASVMPGL